MGNDIDKLLQKALLITRIENNVHGTLDVDECCVAEWKPTPEVIHYSNAYDRSQIIAFVTLQNELREKMDEYIKAMLKRGGYTNG